MRERLWLGISCAATGLALANLLRYATQQVQFLADADQRWTSYVAAPMTKALAVITFLAVVVLLLTIRRVSLPVRSAAAAIAVVLGVVVLGIALHQRTYRLDTPRRETLALQALPSPAGAREVHIAGIPALPGGGPYGRSPTQRRTWVLPSTGSTGSTADCRAPMAAALTWRWRVTRCGGFLITAGVLLQLEDFGSLEGQRVLAVYASPALG